MLIENNIFIVTGGAGGLGEAVVRSLVEKEARVVIFDLNATNGQALVEELGENVCYFPGPVNVTDEVKEALESGLEHFADYTLGGCVICSGVLWAPPSTSGYGPESKLTSFQQFKFITTVNLFGTYCVAQKVAEKLIENEPTEPDNERGVIVTVSSITGLDGVLVGYGTSKAGVAGLTLPLAKELAPFGVRVMNVAPGPFDTPMVASVPFKSPDCLFPNRLGRPSEFADLVSSVITMPLLNGSIIRLDGALR
ncbi:3-hydroxyacyl-CoA dehydrogenase type II [Pilobolus umbonatus]|nr:3-hydroxyacyl-CoA dehydrogenase type II [Pilobolus umbonatus]